MSNTVVCLSGRCEGFPLEAGLRRAAGLGEVEPRARDLVLQGVACGSVSGRNAHMRFAEVVKGKGDLGGVERRDAAIDWVLIGEDVVIYGSRPGQGFRSKCVRVEGSEVKDVLVLLAREGVLERGPDGGLFIAVRRRKMLVDLLRSPFVLDKNKVRVSEDFITLNNVGPGETIKLQLTLTASGSPVSISIQNTAQIPRAVSLTVNSTPQGAMLKVDGTETGTTPRVINVGVGKHTLTFLKEGFTAGNYPLEISPQDVSGGSVSYELGASALDSIELRDGSVLTGDLVSISGMDVEIRVGGGIQHLDRNKIKRVMLVQRDPPTPNLPPVATPQP